MRHTRHLSVTFICATSLFGLLATCLPARAASLRELEFADPQFYLADVHEPLEVLLPRLPNAAAWQRYRSEVGAATDAWIDPRSGAPVGVITRVPLLPGSGVGNRVTVADVERLLGRPVRSVDPATVGDAVLAHVRAHADAFALDVRQLGTPLAESVSPGQWQVWVPQVAGGVPVREAGLLATLRYGNLVLLGVEGWGDVRLEPRPRLDASEASEVGFAFVGGRRAEDDVVQEPALELVRTAAAGETRDRPFAGAVGEGYGHRLAWVFAFRRRSEPGAWEVRVDAHDGRVLSFGDTRDALDRRRIAGGVYQLANTDVCPSAERCGTLHPDFPMPFADTGLPGEAFTDGAGRFSAEGTARTRLQGRYVTIDETCGAVDESAAQGDLDLGGATGEHDCQTPAGASSGNTAGARSAFYELNKLIEMARGWLPNEPFLQQPIRVRLNVDEIIDDSDTCNAFHDGASGELIMQRAETGVCRAAAESPGIFDHEWGHALDFNDLRPKISRPGEAYADIAAAYRLQTSCIGYGFHAPGTSACGDTPDGTGANSLNDRLEGPLHCAIDCSGAREIDFAKHDSDDDGRADAVPDTPQNFVCKACGTRNPFPFKWLGGPCGGEVHCEAAPVTQAAWDLAARDLQAAPFNLDKQSAFLVANRLFFLGSRNVGRWYSCGCARDKSDGCNAGSGYSQWLAADDDNGDLHDGTPHMGALFNAFARHGIACARPQPKNGGCAGAPNVAPTTAVFASDESNVVQWLPVAGAARYRVFRAEGTRACDDGKALLQEVTGTSFSDAVVANERRYCYLVAAVGANDACAGPASACSCATPRDASFNLSCPSPLSAPRGGSGSVACTVSAAADFTGTSLLPVCFAPAGTTCGFSSTPIFIGAGQTKTVTLTVNVPVTFNPGDAPFTVSANSGGRTVTQAMSLHVPSFGLGCVPSSLTVAPGGGAATSCVFTAPGSTTGNAPLSCQHLSSGLSCSFSPPTVPAPLGVPHNVTLTIQAAAAAFPGTHDVDAVASVSGQAVARQTLRVSVPTSANDFQVKCDERALDLLPGETRTLACSVTSLNAFAAPVSLSCGGVSGVSCSPSPANLTPSPGATVATTLTLGVTPNHAAGTFTLRLTGTAGALTRFVDLRLDIFDLVP